MKPVANKGSLIDSEDSKPDEEVKTAAEKHKQKHSEKAKAADEDMGKLMKDSKSSNMGKPGMVV